MTTLTQTWGYTCSFCNKIATLIRNSFVATLFIWMVGHLEAMNRAIQVSRQIEANQNWPTCFDMSIHMKIMQEF